MIWSVSVRGGCGMGFCFLGWSGLGSVLHCHTMKVFHSRNIEIKAYSRRILLSDFMHAYDIYFV